MMLEAQKVSENEKSKKFTLILYTVFFLLLIVGIILFTFIVSNSDKSGGQSKIINNGKKIKLEAMTELITPESGTENSSAIDPNYKYFWKGETEGSTLILGDLVEYVKDDYIKLYASSIDSQRHFPAYCKITSLTKLRKTIQSNNPDSDNSEFQIVEKYEEITGDLSKVNNIRLTFKYDTKDMDHDSKNNECLLIEEVHFQ